MTTPQCSATSFLAFERLVAERYGADMGAAVARSRVEMLSGQQAGADALDMHHAGVVLLAAVFSLGWADLPLRSVNMCMGPQRLTLAADQARAAPLLSGWLCDLASEAVAAPLLAGFDPERYSVMGPAYDTITFVQAHAPTGERELQVTLSASLSAAEGVVGVEAFYGADTAAWPLAHTVRLTAVDLVKIGRALREHAPEEDVPDPDLVLAYLPVAGRC